MKDHKKISSDVIRGCLAEFKRERGRYDLVNLLPNPFSCKPIIANDMEDFKKKLK